MMNWTEKLDSFWKGLVIGLAFPVVIYFIYWLFFHHQIPLTFHIQRMIQFSMLSNLMKICGIGNLLLFYFGISKKLDNFSKGIILSVLIYAALVAYVMYYLEPNVI